MSEPQRKTILLQFEIESIANLIAALNEFEAVNVGLTLNTQSPIEVLDDGVPSGIQIVRETGEHEEHVTLWSLQFFTSREAKPPKPL